MTPRLPYDNTLDFVREHPERILELPEVVLVQMVDEIRRLRKIEDLHGFPLNGPGFDDHRQEPRNGR